MKTLFERLSEEHIKCLMNEKEKYPYSVNSVIKGLKENYFWIDLKYNIVASLVNYFNLNSYSPVEIDKLFTNKN